MTRRRTPTGRFVYSAPLAADLRAWRLRGGRPAAHSLVFPISVRAAVDARGIPVVAPPRVPANPLAGACRAERRPHERSCQSCAAAPGEPCQTPGGRVLKHPHVARERPKVPGRPYDLRHSFASLLLHEGRSVIYVARQLGHDARADTEHLRARHRRARRSPAHRRGDSDRRSPDHARGRGGSDGAINERLKRRARLPLTLSVCARVECGSVAFEVQPIARPQRPS